MPRDRAAESTAEQQAMRAVSSHTCMAQDRKSCLKGWRWIPLKGNALPVTIGGTHVPTRGEFMPPGPQSQPAAQHNVIYG
ncbi:hypothetical protein EYF80_030501 [Liparis tanakae]|uniref:Uncharacterized protein n=1 Tax=Liparis tanakae TaxID=230148 RepID=A0A4Z2H2K3_9TELE|nr:hypothetical protein EYF80_030501 [Liparis tanakae]